MTYDNKTIEDIYHYIVLGTLKRDYKELAPYKMILEYYVDKIFLFDELKGDFRHNDIAKYEESCKYLSKLIKVCTDCDKDIIEQVDYPLLRRINFANEPYDKSSIYYLNAFINPMGMLKERYDLYLKCFRVLFLSSYRLMVGFFQRDVPSFNGFKSFVRNIYVIFHEDHELAKAFENNYFNFYSHFISYFYANGYTTDRVEYDLKKIIENFEYYYDLFTMNVNDKPNRKINNKVYDFVESIVQDIENDKENNNVLIK